MHSFLKNILNNKLATQSIMLLVSTFLSMLFLIGTNFYLTKILDLEQYGNYAFIINMFIFSQIVFNFGFFYSICRLISLEKDDVSIRSYYFAGILIWALLSVAMCVSLSLYSIGLHTNNISKPIQEAGHIKNIFWIFSCRYCH